MWCKRFVTPFTHHFPQNLAKFDGKDPSCLRATRHKKILIAVERFHLHGRLRHITRSTSLMVEGLRIWWRV